MTIKTDIKLLQHGYLEELCFLDGLLELRLHVSPRVESGAARDGVDAVPHPPVADQTELAVRCHPVTEVASALNIEMKR